MFYCFEEEERQKANIRRDSLFFQRKSYTLLLLLERQRQRSLYSSQHPSAAKNSFSTSNLFLLNLLINAKINTLLTHFGINEDHDKQLICLEKAFTTYDTQLVRRKLAIRTQINHTNYSNLAVNFVVDLVALRFP